MRCYVPLALLCGALLVGGCGSTPAPPPVTVALPPPPRPAQPIAPSAPSIEIALPKGAACLGSLDLSQLDSRALDAALAAPLRVISELADVDATDYASVLKSVGVDMRRPLVVAIAGVSDEQRRVIDALRPLVGAGPVSAAPAPAGMFGKVKEALGPLGTTLALRMLVPTLDASRLKAMIGRALAHGWHAQGPGEYSREDGRVYVSVAGEGDTLVVDVALGPDAKRGVAGLRMQVAAGHAAPLALDGRLSAAAFTPSAAADLGFLLGATVTARALGADSVDPDQKDRIAAQGLWEASRTFALAGNERGAFFDAVDVGATLDDGHMSLVLHAVPGRAFVGPSDALWAASFSVAPATEGAVVDLSQPFATAWPLPSDGAGGLRTSTFSDLVNDAGFAAWPIVLPDLVPFASRALVHDLARRFPSPATLDRFERIGAAVLANHEMAYGLLPAKTSRAIAECVLGPPRCAADVRLTLGKTKELVVDGSPRFFRLDQVDKRFVLLTGTDKDMLETKLVTTPAIGPAVLDVAGAPLSRALAELGLPVTHVSGSIERRGSDIVMQVVTR